MAVSTQLKLGDKPTCKDVIRVTLRWCSEKTYHLGNTGVFFIVGSPQWKAGIDAMNAAALKGDIEATKAAGRALMAAVGELLTRESGTDESKIR